MWSTWFVLIISLDFLISVRIDDVKNDKTKSRWPDEETMPNDGSGADR